MQGLHEICGENPDLMKTGQKYRSLCTKTYLRFNVAGGINSP
jgi:hypothetical protein